MVSVGGATAPKILRHCFPSQLQKGSGCVGLLLGMAVTEARYWQVTRRRR